MIDVGINAAPLAAARTGVGRYIAGLLDAFARAPPDGVRTRALFLPGRTARGLRGAVRRLPFAYALAGAARGRVLAGERRRGLVVYHETNHAAPRFAGPVVLTVHDLVTVLHPEWQDQRRARYFGRALRQRAREARLVIVPTGAIARECSEHLGVDPSRVRIIPHGVDGRFTPDGGPRGRFVLYVGALDPRKGLSTLLDALPPGVELVLAGPAEAAPPEVRARLGGRVRATGYVTEDALVGLYRRAALLVLPSLYEGFGLPLLEALACGTPCVASDDPALVEVSGGAALHVPRGDKGALRLGLERVLGDAALAADLSRRGPARARAFSWEACAARHADAYREAAR